MFCLEDGASKSCDEVHLNPKTKEAEYTSDRENGTRKTYSARPASKHWGGTALTVIIVKEDTKLNYDPVNLKGIDSITFRFRTDKETTMKAWLGEGNLLTSTVLNNAAGTAVKPAQADYLEQADDDSGLKLLDPTAYHNWREVTLPVTDPGGPHTLILTFESADTGNLLELDFMRFNGKGVSMP